MQAFSSRGKWGLLSVVVQGLLTALASLAVDTSLGARVSVIVARGLSSCEPKRGLSCSRACGIFPDQGSNPCPLHWQVDS